MTPEQHANTVERLAGVALHSVDERRRSNAIRELAALAERADTLERERAALERLAAFEHALSNWERAYPESVFPLLEDGELEHAMKLCNAEDKNQSSRLYAEWARHIVKCIRHGVEAVAPPFEEHP